MSGADVLVVIIFSGIVLSGVYIAAEYTRWRRHTAAEQKKAADLRELHSERFTRRERYASESRVVATAASSGTNAANADDIAYKNRADSGTHTQAA